MRVSLSYSFLIILFTLFYAPRIPFFELPGSSSAIRLDVLFFMILCLLMLIILIKESVDFKFDLFKASIFSIFFILGLLFVTRGGNPIYSLFQLIWYGSIIFVFCYTKKIIQFQDRENRRLFSLIRIFINLNMLSHLSAFALDYLNILNLYYDQISLIYGIFNMPYAFALMIGVYGLIVFSKTFNVSNFEKILILFSLFLGDSKIVLGGFIISFFFLLSSKQKAYYLIFIALSIFFIFPLIIGLEIRAIQFLFFNLDDLITNQSLNVRLSNFYNYIEWVSLDDFLLGAGSLSYMEYSIQYGKPGPLDVFYLRLLSDFGLITFLLVSIIFVIFCLKNLKYFFKSKNILLSIFSFLFIYSFFNEGLLVIKTGHVISFLVALAFYKVKYQKITFI